MNPSLTIDRIEMHHLKMDYVTPFETSFSRETDRNTIITAVHADGLVGYGEMVAGNGPWYSAETVGSGWVILEDFLIPMLLGQTVSAPQDVDEIFKMVRGNPMARASLEMAVWDLLAKAQGVSLKKMLGAERDRVAVGVSVGIEPTLDELLAIIEKRIDAGYGRVKLKIKPGWDVDVVRAVRRRWPDIPLQVDANSAYRLEQTPIFKELDQYNLLLIEQPFHYQDMLDHAKLQKEIQTPVCLDESIHSFLDAKWALELNACKIINIKVARVGGLSAMLQIHDLCAAHGIPVWCGGMLETNVGRAANLALAALPNFTLPGDISASARYYHEDVAEPNFELNADSTITVPDGVGIGVEVLPDRLAKFRVRYADYSQSS